ncbi:unnamed protein product [Prorocentrum cordatum]|uniref:Uncharacterized protein n=1 Tax=Prorocentrum cordatum TaxID=2364126 RepID=A0ABN9WZ96_9DINO|nr:unnamed protein product [Polarella glacialis]
MADATASALLSVVVRAGGSRQVVAATAVALWRAARAEAGNMQEEVKDVDAEVQARLEAIQPVLRAKVVAAHDESPPAIDGGVKALRNVAEHCLFGEGAEALPKDGKEAKRRQRGRRRGAKDGIVGAASHSELELTEGMKLIGVVPMAGEAAVPDTSDEKVAVKDFDIQAEVEEKSPAAQPLTIDQARKMVQAAARTELKLESQLAAAQATHLAVCEMVFDAGFEATQMWDNGEAVTVVESSEVLGTSHVKTAEF